MREESTKLVYSELTSGDSMPEESRTELAVLAVLPNEEIDFSDIPKQDPEKWRNARLFHDVYTQSAKSVLIEDDILAWLRAGGPGHRDRANAILRERMLAERAARAK